MESLGTQLRRRRRRLGLTLDDLAARTAISKPYLSLIETGRVPNPPSDQKIRRLEQALEFPAGELVSQSHLQRTPRDVRAVLAKLIERNKKERGEASECRSGEVATPTLRHSDTALHSAESQGAPIDLDDAYLTGVLQELVDNSAGNVERIATNAVPVINRVSAGYPRDFTDLSYPPRVADDYVSCPDIQDSSAFATRVHGDSMTPKYREGDIVIFSPVATPRSGDDCFVRFEDGQTTFKRVFFETGPGGGSMLRLQPRNERYAPQSIPGERVAGLYKAVFKYQRVDED